MDNSKFKQTAEAALAMVDNLLAQWLPGGKYKDNEYVALNPTRADEKLGSFFINTTTGEWIDFATQDSGGDLISLYAYLFGCSQGDALTKVKEWLGVEFEPVKREEWHGTSKYKKKTNETWTPIAPFPEKCLDFLQGSKSFNYARNEREIGMRSVYRDSNGNPLLVVQRFIDKETGSKSDYPFAWCSNSKGEAEWRSRRVPNPQPLFGLDELAKRKDAPVLLVEGEKCKQVAAQSELLSDYVVMSWIGGASGWSASDWTPLTGRDVILWADCDSKQDKLGEMFPWDKQPGMKAMLGIYDVLNELGCDVRFVNIPDVGVLPDGYDIADALTDGLMDVSTLLQPENLQSYEDVRYRIEMLGFRQPEKVSPTPTSQSVSQPVAESTLDEQQGDGESDTAYQAHFVELKKYFALVEGKRAAVDVRTAVVYSYQALKARFCKDSVDSWFNQPNKPMRTQYEIKSLKESIELKNKNSDKETVEMMERYVYLDGSSSVWDNQLWRIIDQGAAKLAMGDDFKFWVNSPMRKVIPIDNIVFNPKVLDLGDNYINLFRGLPLQPEYAVPREEMPQDWRDVIQLYPNCRHIFLLVKHLCNDDWLIIQFVMNWLAYPLQNMGAKLATNLVVHGEVQGAGKSWLFDDIMGQIYGEYGGHYGQEDLESIYTANRSAKLYGAFEEVFNNQQKYSNTGKIKNLVTRKTHRIERKFIDAREEANHINAVFTSNEEQPYKLDENDRRALVVSPQKKVPSWLKDAVNEEIANGGVQSFYSLLMSLPLMLDYEYEYDEETGLENRVVFRENPVRFDANTEAPMTEAKKLVISFGRFGWQTFYHQWKNGDIEGVPYGCCKTEDLYKLFMWWVKANNEREMSRPKFLDHIATKMYRAKRWWRCPTSNKPEEKKQNYIFKPKDMRVPDGAKEMDIIGTQVVRFNTAVNNLIQPKYND